MRRAPPRRTQPRMGAGRRIVLALAFFVAMCGLALVGFGGTDPDPPPEEPAPESPTRRALHRAEEAERALMDRDYGRARQRVQEVRRILAAHEDD